MTSIARDGSSNLGAVEFSQVHKRMLELEQELVEFQESSKDLEQALEDELHQLESQKLTLTARLQEKEKTCLILNSRLLSLNQEVFELSNSVAENNAKHEKTVADLKHKLVTMEISNDDILSKDRVVESKLSLANQFNNELLEKLAMVENDLELERQANAQHRLTISNLSNTNSLQPTRLTIAKRDSTYTDLAFAESTILDINEMLATEPPVPLSKSKMPRSESLSRFQDLCSKSDILRQKVDDFNSSLALKSSPTAEVVDPTAALMLSERSSSLGPKSTTMGAANTYTEGFTRSKEVRSRDTISSNGVALARAATSQSVSSTPFQNETVAFSGIRRKLSRKSKLRNAMKNILG